MTQEPKEVRECRGMTQEPKEVRECQGMISEPKEVRECRGRVKPSYKKEARTPSLAYAKSRKNISHDLVADTHAVNLGDSTECKLYVRGAEVLWQTHTKGRDCRIYVGKTFAKRAMLPCRGYDSVSCRAYLLVGKEASHRLLKSFD